jgi:Arc/MetJ-type ribon-helix-helix transcriptional regulator
MTYQFPPDLDEVIKKHMASGQYESEDALLRDALRALDQRDEVLADIEAGFADIEAGRTRRLRDAAADIRRTHGFASE